MTNKIRGIYKLPRKFKTQSADNLVKVSRNSFFDVVNEYKSSKPVFILDFDKTITNRNFHSVYKMLSENFNVIINSANPNKEIIKSYLLKNDLPLPKELHANKGKKKKIVNLKQIALRNTRTVLFYIDDELEYLDFGCSLFMHTYHIDKDGTLRNRTFFRK